MPKGTPNVDAQINALKKMSGSDFALGVWRDLVMLARDERGRAIRLLSALDTSLNRETEAVSAPKS